MSIATTIDDWLGRQVQSNDHTGGDVRAEVSPDGWINIQRPYAAAGAGDPLACHRDWAGPVKLVKSGGKVSQWIDITLGSDLAEIDESYMSDEELEITKQLRAEVLHRVNDFFSGQPRVESWEPPEAKTISLWLTEGGHEIAIDEEGNLRMTVKRSGCDGEIRIERGKGRLRFVMPLGLWSELEPAAEVAMAHLAHEANSRSRLVRIAWFEEENARRCEAQVDLSGLPTGEILDASQALMWRAMVCMAVDALALSLRRLGLELPALAEPANRPIAEILSSSLRV